MPQEIGRHPAILTGPAGCGLARMPGATRAAVVCDRPASADDIVVTAVSYFLNKVEGNPGDRVKVGRRRIGIRHIVAKLIRLRMAWRESASRTSRETPHHDKTTDGGAGDLGGVPLQHGLEP